MKIKVYAPDNIKFERLSPNTNWFGKLIFIPYSGFNDEEAKELLNILHSNKIEIDIKPYEEVSKIDKND